MRRLALLTLGILCGALAVSGQDDGKGEALDRELDRLRTLLKERIEKKAAHGEDRIVPRTYDIGDLCESIEYHLQPLADLVPSKAQMPEEPEFPEPTRLVDIDFLIEMIKMTVEPQSWEAEGADIQPKNGRLFVRTSPRVHGKIEKVLKWLRATMDRRISVDVAVVPVREGDAALLSKGTAELTAEDAQRLSSQAIGAVTLAGFDAQVLGGRSGREISYVKDYDVEVAEGAAIGEPIRGEVFSGCSAQVQACLDSEKGAITECRIELSRVAEPIPTHPTPHGNLELPTMRLTRVLCTFWAPLGRTVVAGGCTVGEDPCVILVTVRKR